MIVKDLNSIKNLIRTDLTFNSELKVFVNEKEQVDYTNGPIEEKIYNILKENNDNSIFSESLHNQISNWATEYHFSSYRQNILRPINIKKEWNILEIGAGCGAISRYLGETGANIVCVEGSLNRAKSIRQRCKDLNNVNVVCSNIDKIDFNVKFDMITLIGVFEYTGKYSSKDNPFESALSYYRSLLKEGGVLAIAIENKLGLKYFSGYLEDHFKKYYYGIEDKYPENNVKTFGKIELEKMLKTTGFTTSEFLYPFPDYKLPRFVVTEKGITNKDFNVEDIIFSTVNRHYTNAPKANNIDEKLVWKSLRENNVLNDFSNSFLVLAYNNKRQPSFSIDLLAEYYTTNRKAFPTVTKFNEKIGTIQCHKEYLLKQDTTLNSNNIISHNLDAGKYVKGRNFDAYLYELLEKGNYSQYKLYLNKWIQYLILESCIKENKEVNTKTIISGIFYDCVPSNMILDDNDDLKLIDKEWEVKEGIILGVPILRYMKKLKRKKYHVKQLGGFNTYFEELMKENNLTIPDKTAQRNAIELYNNIIKVVNLKSSHQPKDVLWKTIAKTIIIKINDIKDVLFYKNPIKY